MEGIKKGTKREVAYRIFSFELEDTTVEEKEKQGIKNEQEDEDASNGEGKKESEGIEEDEFQGYGEPSKLPNYVITPTGLKVNRVLVVGRLLTLPQQVGDPDKDLWKVTLSDGFGHFYILTQRFDLETTSYVKGIVNNRDLPKHVFLVGKVKTYRPDNKRIYLSIKPERLCDSSPEMYNYWVLQTAKSLLRRLECLEELDKMEPGTLENLMAIGFTKSEAEAALRAKEHYGITKERIQLYRENVIEALRRIAGKDVEAYAEDEESQSPGEVYASSEMDEEDEQRIYEIIKSFKEEGVSLEELARLTGVDANKIEDISLSLIEKGLIDEPYPSKYRAIDYE